MNEEKIKCECGELFSKQNFKTHYKKCAELIHKFKEFDFKMIQLIKKYLNSKERLILIKFFLQRYVKILSYQLSKIFNNKIIIPELNKINIKNDEPKNIIPSIPNKNNLIFPPVTIKTNDPQLEKRLITFQNNNKNNYSPIEIISNKSNNALGLGINNFSPIYAENENNNFSPISNKTKNFNNKKGIEINNFNPIYAENENTRNKNLYQVAYVYRPENKNSFDEPYSQFQLNRAKTSKYEENFIKHLKSSESQDNNNTEIEIKFMNSNVAFSAKGKLSEKLIEVMKRFEKENCPPWMKKFLAYPTYNGKIIDPQKTLYEIGIKNRETIVLKKGNNENNNIGNFKNNNIINNNSGNFKNNNIINNNSGNIKNNIIINNKGNIKNNNLVNNNNNGLIKNNKIIYNNINNNIVNINKDIDNINNNDEVLRLMLNKLNEINNNQKSNKNEVILGDSNSSPILSLRHHNSSFINNPIQSGIFTIDEIDNVEKHHHKLVLCITIFDWFCKVCKRNLFGKNPRYYCSLCDFNICVYCKDKNNGYLKLEEFDEFDPPDFNFNQKFVKSSHHEHHLVYLSRRSGFGSWECNVCENTFPFKKWSFYCTECDYDMCLNCFKSNN